MMFTMPKTPDRSKPLREKLMLLDLLGTGLFALCLISLLLALQYGVDRPWSDPLIIALLAISAAALPVFLFQQTKRKRQGLFPRRIIRIRNVWAACGLLSFLFATLGNIFYYLPLFFQVSQFHPLSLYSFSNSYRPFKGSRLVRAVSVQLRMSSLQR